MDNPRLSAKFLVDCLELTDWIVLFRISSNSSHFESLILSKISRKEFGFTFLFSPANLAATAIARADIPSFLSTLIPISISTQYLNSLTKFVKCERVSLEID